MTEIPRYWRLRTERERFSTKVVLEANDWKIVEGFGNNLWVVSKTGDKNFALPKENPESPLHPRRNGHNLSENPLENTVIYEGLCEEKI